MSKIICSGCKETFAELRNPEEAKAYLNEIKVDNLEEDMYTCDTCTGTEFELEPTQTFGLLCDKCHKKVNYFDSKYELGDLCECGGTMLPCMVNA